MALAATLEADFGDGGFDLDVTVDGLGGDLSAIDVPAIDLDGASIADAAASIDGIGTATIGDAVAAIVDGLTAVGVEVPLLDELIGPLTAAIDLGRQLTELDIDALAAVGELGSDIEGTGLDAIEARIRAVTDGVASGPVRTMIDLLGGAVPGGLDLDGVFGELGSHGAAIKELVVQLGGLMAVEAAVRDAADGAALVLSMMEPTELSALVGRLETWRLRDPADLLVGIDPDDPDLTAIVAPVIVDFARDVRLTAEALTRGLGFGQATLVGIDVPGVAARLDAAVALLSESGTAPIRALSEQIVEWCRPLLDAPLPDPADSLDAFWQLARDQVGALASGIDQLDPAVLAGGLVGGLEPVLGFVDTVRQAADEVVVAISSALATVRQLVEAVDLGPLIAEIQTVLEPIEAVIDTVTGLIGDAEATIQSASDAVVAAMDTVRTSMQTAADLVSGAFGRIQAALDALDLANLQATLEAGIAPIATALEKAQVRPFFDTAIDIVDTTADVVGAVPLGLLPDDAKADLAEAVEPIKQIDVQRDVADVLNARLAEILDQLDTTVLDEIEQAYAEVIAFLESVDPGAPIEQLEADVYEPFLETLRAIDPTAILQPLDDAIAPVRDAIGGFDLGSDLLDPIDAALDDVQEALAPYEPSTLLAPVVTEIDEVRTAITEFLHIEELHGWLDQAEATVDEWVGRLDPDQFTTLFTGAFDRIVADVAGPSRGVGVVPAAIAGLLRSAGIDARPETYDTVSAWIRGEPSVLQPRLTGPAGRIGELAEVVRQVDLTDLVAGLAPIHRGLVQQIEALPENSLLRLSVEIEVTAASPTELLGPFADAAAHYADALDAAASELDRLAGSERLIVDAVAAALRDALRPLSTIGDWVRSLLGRFGLDPSGKTPREIAAELLATLSPDTVLEPLLDAIRSFVDRLAALASDGVLQPAREIVTDVEAALAAIDIGFVADELDAIYADLLGAIDAIRPSAVLGDLLTSIEALQAELAGFDPLAPVEAAVTAMTDAITEGSEALRPTVLFAPVTDIYDQIVDALGALDIRALLDPLLLALDAIAAQLGGGLNDLAVAIKRLQDALPDAADLAGGGGASASVSLSVGG
ncbi:MAG: hypothetical protein QNJ12_07150 [Ilumatobacter sp.]|uniref:hypothetical protein n=1 Tax=Ilumatobacter sp. TaxID=1967498 RepID=UPI00260B6913|nr:hypothetical protein [Ilumatobacter sp.]MDJ0768554.1 hypothetical protein [Ilumatobacter sp.]